MTPTAETATAATAGIQAAETSTAEGSDRCLRRDAQANRRRILDAARDAFAEDGLDVSLIDIARRAGVGNATLHRNFTKERLVDALFDDWLHSHQVLAERALEDPDPWHGLTTFMADVIADASLNRALLDIFMIRLHERPREDSAFAQLARRAQVAGALRADATIEDLFLIFWGLGRTLAITSAACPVQGHRQLTIALEGLRARPGQEPLPGKAITTPQLHHLIGDWAQDALGKRRCSGD